MSDSEPLIVDAHVHLWDESSRYYPALAAENLRCDVEHFVELQQAAGVSRAVIIQGSADAGEYDYMRECVRRYPGRFALVGYVDPREPSATDYIRTCRDRGLSGVRVPVAGTPRENLFADPRGTTVWEAAEERGIVLCLYLQAHQAPWAKAMLERFPGARVTIDHFGLPLENGHPAPHLIRRITDLARFPNVHVKLSAFPVVSREPYPHADSLDLARTLLDTFGAHRLLWGTDFPYIQRQCGYKPGLELLTEHAKDLSETDRGRLLGDTARGLFQFV